MTWHALMLPERRTRQMAQHSWRARVGQRDGGRPRAASGAYVRYVQQAEQASGQAGHGFGARRMGRDGCLPTR
jgi:hypothetical protein